jgi:hypothetical protein
MDSLPSTSFTIRIYNIKWKNSKFFYSFEPKFISKNKAKKPKIFFSFVSELD